MKICLRDDDTNFFTSVEQLTTAFGELWGNVPLTVGVIPSIHQSNIISTLNDNSDDSSDRLASIQLYRDSLTKPAAASDYFRTYPVGDNTELVAELCRLIQLDMLSIAIHGYSHRFDVGHGRGSEFSEYEINEHILAETQWYFEKIFGVKANIFIPPSNRLTLKSIKTLVRGHYFNFSSGFVYSQNKFDKAYNLALLVLKDGKFIYDRLVNKIKTIDITSFNQKGSVALGYHSDKSAFLDVIKRELDYKGSTSIATHYATLYESLDYRDKYYWIVNELSKMNDVEFVSGEEYFAK